MLNRTNLETIRKFYSELSLKDSHLNLPTRNWVIWESEQHQEDTTKYRIVMAHDGGGAKFHVEKSSYKDAMNVDVWTPACWEDSADELRSLVFSLIVKG